MGVEKIKKKVAQYTLNGDFVAVYESLSVAAREIKGDSSVISKVCDETKRNKTYKGFVWKFVVE